MIKTEVGLGSHPVDQFWDQQNTWRGRIKTIFYPKWGQGREIVSQSPRKGWPDLAEASMQHCIMLFQCPHLSRFMCEKQEDSYMLQQKVAKFAVVYNFMWEWWFHYFLVSQLIHPCQGQVQRLASSMLLLPSILTILRLDFLNSWKIVFKCHFKHFIYKLNLNISFCCLHRQPCNLSREWVCRIVPHSFFLKFYVCILLVYFGNKRILLNHS